MISFYFLLKKYFTIMDYTPYFDVCQHLLNKKLAILLKNYKRNYYYYFIGYFLTNSRVKSTSNAQKHWFL